MKHGIIIGIQTQKQRDIHAKNFTHPIVGGVSNPDECHTRIHR